MNPRDVKPMLDTPLNRLFFAINHYVTTGDHIGEGIATGDEKRMRVTIPVRTDSKDDQANFAAFRSRFEELADKYRLVLGYLGEHRNFEGWTFEIDVERMDALAVDLRERPGPLGWGTGKTVIDAYQWDGAATEPPGTIGK